MSRTKAHFEGREPLLEKFLSILRFNKVIKHIPKKGRVLDLGCGYNGQLLRMIQNRNNCTGIDLSVSKKENSERFRLLEHDLNAVLPFSEDSFDVVVSLANLEHVESPEHMFREIIRVLRPGGKILLTTPTTYSKPVLEFLSYKLHLISEEEIRDHKNYFNKKILLELCKSNGISVCRHRYFQFFMNNFIVANK